MPSFELLVAFFITTALFAYIPGPAMLYAAAQTMARGRLAGLMAVLGIHVGCYVHIIAAAAGLSILFQAVPWLYLAVKLGGACYLIWLGFTMLRARQEDGTATAIAPKSAKRAFLESIIVDVLNPKTALFFLAFLPQFVDPAAAFPVWLQFLILGIAVNIIFSSADLCRRSPGRRPGQQPAPLILCSDDCKACGRGRADGARRASCAAKRVMGAVASAERATACRVQLVSIER